MKRRERRAPAAGFGREPEMPLTELLIFFGGSLQKCQSYGLWGGRRFPVSLAAIFERPATGHCVPGCYPGPLRDENAPPTDCCPGACGISFEGSHSHPARMHGQSQVVVIRQLKHQDHSSIQKLFDLADFPIEFTLFTLRLNNHGYFGDFMHMR
jgi:hypothetical protein